MTNVDSQRIREIRDNTRAMAEAFGRIADTLAEALELYVSTQTETQNSNLTFEKDECAKEYEELGLKELKELIEADRKTESNSEKPNNCEECKHWSDTEDGCADRHGCKTTEDCSTVPTSSKMEQVDEPQNGYQTFNGTSVYVSKLEDEPQYEMGMGTLKCDNCSEYGSFKCTKCDGEMYFKRLEPKDEPQTERSE